MKGLAKNSVIGLLILTVTIFFLFNCATKKEAAKPSETAEPAKPVSEPPPKAQEPQQATPSPTPPPPSQKPTIPVTAPPPSPPPKAPEAIQPAPKRMTEVVPPFVNLRQGPSIDSKIIRVLKKGTQLAVLEEKTGWLHVKLEDGAEGWVGKNMTSEGAQPKSP